MLEVAGPAGEVLDHFEGRTLNPGHAIECAWFVLHEAKLRGNWHYQQLGLRILDAMWQRGWDPEFGGRPVRRAIQRELQNPLAKFVLEGSFQSGTRLKVKKERDGLKIQSI